MSESNHQAALVQWWGLQYPHLKNCLISYPSGAIIGGKNKFALIAKLKNEGWRTGVSDLFLAVPRGGKHGLWIEMKDIKKTLCSVSQEQRDHIDLMHSQGYEAIWCAGFEVAKAAIETYMNLSNK
jgi:hypothetical protein